MSKFVARQVMSLVKNAQQSQNLTRALLFLTNFLNPQQVSLLRDKLITHGDNRETSTKTKTKQW